MDFDDPEETSDTDLLSDDETVASTEVAENNVRIIEYVSHIKDIARSVGDRVAHERGDFLGLKNANQRQEWLEYFTNALYESQDFGQLSLDIMDVLADRFELIMAGKFEYSATGWPTIWYYEEENRDAFLKQVRWFSSNHDQQFGRLLTPLVDGVRVRGPFQPTAVELRDNDRQLVLLDGEGLGHSAKEATSVSTKVTEKFPEVDMILLVDTSQSPLQAASLELLRSVGSSGHGHKLAVAFTHFDQVKGDNLGSYKKRRSHVRASIGNAIGSLRESLGAPVAEILERQMEKGDFYLGELDRPTGAIRRGFIKAIHQLMERMRQSANPVEPTDLAPSYNIARLELALRDAADGFKSPWLARLGLNYHEGIRKEHWGRIKALCRRIANLWDVEYNGLRPVADLVRQLQASISLWLDSPSGWTREPLNEDERQAAIDEIRRQVFMRIHDFSKRRLISSHPTEWRAAFSYSGTGSSRVRARGMSGIYEEAAPSITSIPDPTAQEFLNEVIQIVNDAVEEAGGSVYGAQRDNPMESPAS